MSAVAAEKQDARAKGLRLLAEGRLIVERIQGGAIIASCRGDSGEVYALGFDPRNQEWRCTCVARGVCSHLHALMTVTVKPQA